MSILGWGTSLAELIPGGAIGIAATTTAARKAPAVAEGIDFSNASFPQNRFLHFTAASEVWISFYYKDVNNSANSREIGIGVRSGSQTLFQWGGSSINNPSLFLQYWNGSAWVTVGTASLVVDSLNKIVFHIKIDDTVGVVEYYVNGLLIGSFSGDTLTTAFTTVDNILFRSTNSSGLSMTASYSAVIVADEDISDVEMVQTALSGNGGETSWTGDYTAVDETGLSDADTINANVNDAIETFTKGASSVFSAYEVIGVGVSARAMRGATGPQNLQLVARSGSTNGVSATKSLNTTWSLKQELFTQDPATSAAWTYANADSAEVGVKAIA